MSSRNIILVCDDKKAIAQLIIASVDVPSGVSEVQLVPVGEWKGYRSEDEEGKPKLLEFKITEDVIAQMEKNFRGDVVLDFEHQTLTGDIAPAAGWIKKLVNKGKDGLWAVVEWTDKALEYIKNKEYRFLSPVFTLAGIDPRTGEQVGAMLLNAGLTNQPFFKELKPIVSKHALDQFPEGSIGDIIFLTTIAGKDTIMEVLVRWLRSFLNLPTMATVEEVQAELQKVMDSLKSTAADATVTAKQIVDIYKASLATQGARTDLIGVLGLKPEATNDELKAKATDLIANVGTALSFKGEVIAALGLKPEATVEEVRALVISGKNNSVQLAETVTKLADLEAKEFDREFDRIIAKAFFDGKIHPTQPKDAEWSKSQKDLFKAKGSDAYTEYWGKQPVIAPVGKLPTDVVAGKAADWTEDDEKVSNLLGVKKEIVQKHNKGQ